MNQVCRVGRQLSSFAADLCGHRHARKELDLWMNYSISGRHVNSSEAAVNQAKRIFDRLLPLARLKAP